MKIKELLSQLLTLNPEADVFVHVPSQTRTVPVIKIGSDSYKATPEDLEVWRKTWEEGVKNNDFAAFTHNDVQVEQAEVGVRAYTKEVSNVMAGDTIVAIY